MIPVILPTQLLCLGVLFQLGIGDNAVFAYTEIRAYTSRMYRVCNTFSSDTYASTSRARFRDYTISIIRIPRLISRALHPFPSWIRLIRTRSFYPYEPWQPNLIFESTSRSRMFLISRFTRIYTCFFFFFIHISYCLLSLYIFVKNF